MFVRCPYCHHGPELKTSKDLNKKTIYRYQCHKDYQSDAVHFISKWHTSQEGAYKEWRKLVSPFRLLYMKHNR